jgi:serine/threonine protein kinase
MQVQPSRTPSASSFTQSLQPGNTIVAYTNMEYRNPAKRAKRYFNVLVRIDEIIQNNVLRCSVSCDGNNTILKLFPADSAKMVSELRAYEALKPLQGSAIPEFIGIFNLDCFDGLAIAYDAVDGITAEEFFKVKKPDIPFYLSVWDEIRRIHNYGIAHRDIRAENVLVGKDDKITILDFDHSA